MAAPDVPSLSRKEFAQLLKTARDHLRITQPQMAKRLRVHVKTYRNWEWEKTTARAADVSVIRARLSAMTAAADTPWSEGSRAT